MQKRLLIDLCLIGLIGVLASCTVSDEYVWINPEAIPVSSSRTPTPAPSVSHAPNPTAAPTESPSAAASSDSAIDLSKASGKLLDLSIPSFGQSALLVLNKNGQGLDYPESAELAPYVEPVGTLPSYPLASARRINATSPVLRKDRTGQTGVSAISARALSLSSIRQAKITGITPSYSFYDLDRRQNFTATNVYSGTECIIFAQSPAKAGMTQTRWNSLGAYFDGTIYSRVIDKFGDPCDVDGNGRVVLCFFDFQDPGILGYFCSADLENATPQYPSPQMEVLFLNSNCILGLSALPADHDEMKRTMAHEFQHLINYAQREMKGKPGMDTWINEGMAESAEQVALDTVGEMRLYSMQEDTTGVPNGQSLTVWDGNGMNYALSYTFMQYCKSQSSAGDGIFKQLLSATYGDYRAVAEVMSGVFSSFTQLNIAYRLANLIHGSGIYGYGSQNASFNFGATKSPTKRVTTLPPSGALCLRPSLTDLRSFQPSYAGSNLLFIRVNGQ